MQSAFPETAEFFDRLARRGHEPLLARARGTVRIDLLDGEQNERWLVAVDRGDITVSRRNLRGDCTLRTDKALFEAIARGEMNATAAALRGDLEIEGDWELVVLFQRLFPSPPPSRKGRR
jgi:putative sterol carrier protein